MRILSTPAGGLTQISLITSGALAMQFQQSPFALALAREAAVANFARASVPPVRDERGNAQYENHFVWFGEVAVSLVWTPKKGPNGKLVEDKDSRVVMFQRAKLEAHGPGSRARALPLGTSFDFGGLHHVRANEPANARELKKLVLVSLYGDDWAIRSDVKYEQAPKGHAVTLVDEGEQHVVKAGVADTDAPGRKRGRRRTKAFAEVVVEDSTVH